MKYEWNIDKEKQNLAKHGVSFSVIDDADWSLALVARDERFRYYGEERFLAYVPIQRRLYAVVYAIRGANRRIISLRKANQREVKYYGSQTK